MKLFDKTDQYNKYTRIYQQIRAAIEGKHAVIDIVSCLPAPQYKEYGEYSYMTDEQRSHANRCAAQNALRTQSYWARGRFFNATARTKESLCGMVFSNEPEVDLPASVEYLEFNANGQYSALREVAQKAIDEVVCLGRFGVLVDMPYNETRLTRAQQESGNYSPRLICYKAEQILYARKDDYGLAEVRLLESKEVPKDGSLYEYETKDFLRRLVMIDGVYVNQLFDDNEKLIQEVTPIVNGSPSKEILFQFFGSDSNNCDYSKAPLYDLANINLGHFVLDCDNRDNLHFHGQGTTVVYTGMDSDQYWDLNPNGLDTGAKGVNLFDQGDKVEVLQIDASGAIPAEMEKDEQRMIYIGAQIVQNNSSNQTLGAKKIETSASTSTLKRIANNVSHGMETCIGWCMNMLGDSNTEQVSYKINTEFFTDEMDAQKLALHFQTVQGGLMPKSSYWEVARQAGLTHLSNDEIDDELNESALDVNAESEEMARLRAENEALKEQLNGE